MNKPAPSSSRSILPPAKPREPVASPYGEAVDAYYQERRKGLRAIGLFSVFCVCVAAAFLLTLGRMTAAPQDLAQEYSAPAPRPATPGELERLRSDNLTLKEQLHQADIAINELRALLLRESPEAVAEENTGGSPAEKPSKAETDRANDDSISGEAPHTTMRGVSAMDSEAASVG